MQRYFVNGNINNFSFLEGDVFHLQKVMRFRDNDQIELVIENKLYLANIDSINPLRIFLVKEINENRELSSDITLLYCLPKGDKLDLVIQKAAELGVKRIVGVNSSRTVVKIEEKDKSKKLERYKRIIKEASEQSKRLVMPEFCDIIDYQDIKKYVSKHNFIAYEGEALNDNNLFKQLSEIKNQESVSILIGAEGGFALDEVKFANRVGFQNVSLGKLILRSETAAIYFMSVLAFVLSR